MIKLKHKHYKLGAGILEKNYFEAIYEEIIKNEKTEKLKTEKISENSFKISNGDLTYEISYDKSNKKVVLKALSNETKEEKIISSWLLDNQSATQKDTLLIAEDFIESIAGKTKTIITQTKKKDSSGNNNSGLFFANRMATFFPELKENIQAEKETYESFREATFAKEFILPLVNNHIKTETNKSKLNKLGKTFSELYKTSGLNIRSIITMAILNGLDEENAKFSEFLSDELKTAWKHAKKYKGKKIKPEKAKKTSMFVKAMKAQQLQNKQ